MRLGQLSFTTSRMAVPCVLCDNEIGVGDYKITVYGKSKSGYRIFTRLHVLCLSRWMTIRWTAHNENRRKRYSKSTVRKGGRPTLGLSPEVYATRHRLLRQRSNVYTRAARLDIADPELDRLYLRLVDIEHRLVDAGGVSKVADTPTSRAGDRRLRYGKDRMETLAREAKNRSPGAFIQARLVPSKYQGKPAYVDG